MNRSPHLMIKPDHTAALDYIGWEILSDWQEAHGGILGHISSAWDAHRVTFQLDDIFSLAEINLGQNPQGQRLLERYVRELLGEICHQRKAEIAQLTRRPVARLTIHVDPAANLILCVFLLGQHANNA